MTAGDCLESMTINSKDSDFEEIIEHSEKIEEEELINCVSYLIKKLRIHSYNIRSDTIT